MSKRMLIELKSIHNAMRTALEKYLVELASELSKSGHKVTIQSNGKELLYILHTDINGSPVEIDLFSEDTSNNCTIGNIQFHLLDDGGSILTVRAKSTIDDAVSDAIAELDKFISEVADDYITRAKDELNECLVKDVPIDEFYVLNTIYNVLTDEDIELPSFLIDIIKGCKRPLRVILNSPTLLSAIASAAYNYDFK